MTRRIVRTISNQYSFLYEADIFVIKSLLQGNRYKIMTNVTL